MMIIDALLISILNNLIKIFNSPWKLYRIKSEWMGIVDKLVWHCVYEENLGIDETVVPKHHYLYVIESLT